MTVVIVILCIMMYLLLGAWLFTAAIEQLGGKSMYLEIIHDKTGSDKALNVIYYLMFFLVLIFWPLFVIRTIIGSFTKKEK